MLSICRELFSNRKQRVVVVGAAIVSGWRAIGKCVGVVSSSVLYTSEMFELVENRLYAYANDFTLVAVVRKPADRPSVAIPPLTWTWLGFRSRAISGA